MVLCLLLCFGDAGGVVLLRHDGVRRECFDRDVVEEIRAASVRWSDVRDGEKYGVGGDATMRGLVVWMIELVDSVAHAEGALDDAITAAPTPSLPDLSILSDQHFHHLFTTHLCIT